MKKYINITLSIMFLCLTPLHTARAEAPVAHEIMQKVEDRDQGDNMAADAEMILFDKRGKQRTRVIKTFSKEKGEDRYAINFFLQPADVKGTASLA